MINKILGGVLICKKVLLNKDLFENNDGLENFNSLDCYDIDKRWRQIKNINEIPEDVPINIAECIVDFEKDCDKFQDGNEWGKTYNLTTGENYGLVKGSSTNVRLTTHSRDINDILFAIHIHPNGTPPSFKDVFRTISNNNLGFVAINTSYDVFLMESIKKINFEKDFGYLVNEYYSCKDLGIKYALLNKTSILNSIKIKFISSNILNKYINFFWWIK